MRDYTQEVHDLYNTIDCFGPDTIQYNEARNSSIQNCNTRLLL